MAQHDFNIANQTFPNFRSDLNDALQAAGTISAGSSAPTTTYAYQLWFDTSVNTYKIRNAANSAWISVLGNDLTNAGINTEKLTVTGDLTVDTNTLKVDSANNRLGIGTASPSTFLTVEGDGVPLEINSTVSNIYKMRFKNAGTLTSYLGTNPNAFYFADASATQLARIDSDGLKLGTDSAAANALDDYEHGTWTPAVNDGTTSPTYTTQEGYYVKIGDQVFIDFYIRFASGTANGNIIRIYGLPYTTSSTFRQGFGTTGYQNVSNKVVTWYANSGVASTQGYVDGNDIFSAASGSSIAGKYIIGGFTYSVAA